ncbi:uncharacterized protein BDV14DRAFT_168041 [Aspergillus stella-maris]|uniref:uncharacterized protein n=1 Tax=Aspergillus stella-maris TaxID=1810926 RepID=UPI003CCCC312
MQHTPPRHAKDNLRASHHRINSHSPPRLGIRLIDHIRACAKKSGLSSVQLTSPTSTSKL